MITREDIVTPEFDKTIQKIKYHLKSAMKAYDELEKCIKTTEP